MLQRRTFAGSRPGIPHISFLTTSKIKCKILENSISKGQKIGTLEIINNNETVLTSDLIALEDVEAKGILGRLWSKFILWLISLFGTS